MVISNRFVPTKSPHPVDPKLRAYLEREFQAVARAVRTDYESSDVRHYGALANDGSTDESAELQAAVDANKGGLVVIPAGHTVLAAGILLSGSTYDGTTIRVEGTLKLAPSGGAANFQSAVWGGIIFHDCDDFVLELYDSDGNRSNQSASEFIHMVVVAGCANGRIPIFRTREIRGDGLYVSQATLTSSSDNSTNLYLGDVAGYNSADDGRNLVSIISCDRLTIDNLVSYQIGGTIGASLQPGGLDFEPNQGYHSITDVVIGAANIVTAGTGGFNIYGQAITNDATRDWNIQRVAFGEVLLTRTGTSGSGIAASAIFRARDVTGKARTRYATTRGAGWNVDYADRVFVELHADNCTNGAVLGGADELRDSVLECVVTRYSTAGVRTCLLTDVTVRGRVFDSESVAASTPFAVQCHDEARGGITQTNVVYEIDAPYDGVNARAFRNEPTATVAYSQCVARNCNWDGYASFSVQCDAQIPTENITGRNTREATAQPANGTFVIGDRVYNASPTIDGNDMVLIGWTRLTSGTGHVAGTDWANIRVSDVSPAT